MLKKPLHTLVAVCVAGACALSASVLQAQKDRNTGEPQILSTGQRITPLAPHGATFEPLNPGLSDNPSYTVGQAVSTAISPDGKALLLLTSGYNLWNYASGPNEGTPIPTDSTEWVFVFDISKGKAVRKQTIPIANTYSGIAWNPSGAEFFVSGGANDSVHIFSQSFGAWTEEVGSPVALGHPPNPPVSLGGLGLITRPEAAGVAVSPDGTEVIVADYENDSISTLTRVKNVWTKTAELDLRPGKENPGQTGIPGGEYPFWVQIKGDNTAFISSVRDRQIVVVRNNMVLTRISVPGQPNKMTLNKAGNLLFVAQDNSNYVEVIDTNNDMIVDSIQVAVPAEDYNKNSYLGANPNSVTLSPDEKTLYVTNGGLNAVAVIHLGSPGGSQFAGLIPTGFYPNSVSVSADGKMLYVVNGKSATGPNPGFCDTSETNAQTAACDASNQYIWQLTKAGFQTLPTPKDEELEQLSELVVDNDHLGRRLDPHDQWTMDFLHTKIQHVIYIIKENRTYDQVLGDLPVGNGDPSLAQFPLVNTPNFHKIASNFVDFDNFDDVSDVSGDGWPWSTSARTTDVIEKEIPVNYANRGLDNDSEGTNRNVNVGIPVFVARVTAEPLIGTDPNLLPGNANVAAPDSDDGEQGQGYLWNGALKANLTLRNYGFFLDLARYNLTLFPSLNIAEDPTPFADNLQVAYPTNTVLSQYTDLYYRGFDNSFPDYFRFTEWQREFNKYVTNGNLPNLSLVRLMHDHFGNFDTAINGVNTPELEIADNDYAVGSLIQAVANSPYKDNTLIFVIEDDAQDGADHVDAHRSTAFIVGPYVKHGFVDSRHYNTVSMLATIERVLGISPLNLNDANAEPMADAFDIDQKTWRYTATPSTYLATTTLLPPSAFAKNTMPLQPLHNAAWWTAHTRGMDFSVEDHLDSAKFNRVVWRGVMGDRLYPAARSGADLRSNREILLAKYYQGQTPKVWTTSSTSNSAAQTSARATTATR